MFCPNCGANIGEVKFCPNCGANISSSKFCVHCGTNMGTAKFCPNCGASASNNTTQSESTVILDTMSQDEFGIGNEVSAKRKNITLVLAILFGYIGIHRFYVGKYGTGVLWLFSYGIFFVGWIYDIYKIVSGTFRDGAGLPIVR